MKLLKYDFWNETTGYNDDAAIEDAVIAISDTAEMPANYSEIPSIENWHKYAFYVSPADTDESFATNFGTFANLRDWKCLRVEVKKAIESKAGGAIGTLTVDQWNTLAAPEKLIAVEYCLNKLPVTQTVNGCPDIPLLLVLKSKFDVRSTISRKKRWSMVRGACYGMLMPSSQATALLKDVESLGLVSSYIGGLEGIDEGDIVSGIMDWIKTQNEYSANGLTTKNLVFNTGYTLDIFKNTILSYLNGLY